MCSPSCPPGGASRGAGAVPGGSEGDQGSAAAGARSAGGVPQRPAPRRADRDDHHRTQQQDQTLAEGGGKGNGCGGGGGGGIYVSVAFIGLYIIKQLLLWKNKLHTQQSICQDWTIWIWVSSESIIFLDTYLNFF